MIDRKHFLTTLFDSLEANGVRYCLLRNYDNLYTATTTDVDLLVAPHSLARFKRCLHEAAVKTEYRFVHEARYVNYSNVYWHPGTGFTRIDFETEVRWRVFTLLGARPILDARRKHDSFYIPDPKHESVILFVAALWRGFLSERYRRRLALLYAECPDKAELRQTLCEAFGAVGQALAEFQAQPVAGGFDRALCWRLRRSIYVNSNRSGWRLLDFLRNTVADAGRLWDRLRRPAGVSLLFASSTGGKSDFDSLMHRVNFLFPASKCVVQTFDLTRGTLADTRWSLKLRLNRLRVLFKGGMFVRAYETGRDADLAPILRTHAGYLYPACTFMCVEDSMGRLYMAHCNSGLMMTHAPASRRDMPDFSQLFVGFISKILERTAAVAGEKQPKTGMFCVLVGLDGSGKTTLARNLCTLVADESQFSGVRYFHWRPKVFANTEFPLPEFQNLPRKEPPPQSVPASLLSGARLVKNLLLTTLAYHLRVRPLIRRGYLVLVDRYFYNYYLDPASVKYSGPRWLLDQVRKFFPQPDFVVTLKAPPNVLLQRKQELAETEITRQAAALDGLPLAAARVVAADASQPEAEVAQTVMQAILEAAKHV
jgi:thymidylate kinase